MSYKERRIFTKPVESRPSLGACLPPTQDEKLKATKRLALKELLKGSEVQVHEARDRASEGRETEDSENFRYASLGRESKLRGAM